ncbi:MAG: hypothetical protein HY680_07610 [Chloroflexi bacterium]|nr:hypothetical protein [Chloroflexota bacterium]
MLGEVSTGSGGARGGPGDGSPDLLQVQRRVWPQTYERLRHVLKEPVLLVTGTVSRREGTMNIVVQGARVVQADQAVPRSKAWG